MQGGVELDAGARAGADLERAGDGVAQEQQPRHAGRAPRALTTRPSGSSDLRAGRDVAAGLDHAVVAERDADAAVRADQAALADADDLLAAAATACP